MQDCIYLVDKQLFFPDVYLPGIFGGKGGGEKNEKKKYFVAQLHSSSGLIYLQKQWCNQKGLTPVREFCKILITHKMPWYYKLKKDRIQMRRQSDMPPMMKNDKNK